MDLKELIDQARVTTAAMDATDAELGAASPAKLGVDALIETATAALEAGIVNDDWLTVAEGLLLLYAARDMKGAEVQAAEDAFRLGWRGRAKVKPAGS